ncbi:unnamed protein product [Orchesella dallaii]|uniref:Protein kinase domain-containing protein n=1 Tax=Orchesella dallaii TaxID=48710 RepID=A0ABP1QHJ4_9HEXA
MDFKKLFDKFRFRRGSSKPDQFDDGLEISDVQVKVESIEPVEIEEKLDIDWQQIIGLGNFSVVYVGYLNGLAGPVAVKVPKACDESSSNSYINTLKEVSIMESIGKHENVIHVLGFHTICDLHLCPESTVGIITPLCVNGSLQKYLRSKPVDITVIGDDNFKLNYNQEVSPASCMSVMSFYELLKFSYEIAQGMNYLSSKNVVHGDLAARNVLLDENKTCKISDFGMSKLIKKEDSNSSSNKVEQTTENERRILAWRWMAIECLEGSDVSFQSDVWAYGVTIWEIFTIGDAPFPRYSYDSEFLQNLKCGQLRLQKPKYASAEIYDTMLNCWAINSEIRPNFSFLRDFFHKLLLFASVKMKPLECNKNPELQQPLLRIRQREEINSANELSLQSEQCRHRVSFRHGGISNAHLILSSESDNENIKGLVTTYDLKNAEFMYNHPLIGRTGTMYKEELNGKPVAVRRCDMSTMEALNELKVISIVGDHPHVVKFIGMFHDEILMTGVKHMNIVSEFCENRTIGEYFGRNFPQDYRDLTVYTKFPDNIFLVLCRFASEIARGMEYISSKQVVQADLSSQMILLDRNLTCKIRLSSVSRQVYEDRIYIKTTPGPLNWRILAVETLKRLEFSTKTDVWSFGITAWEIFNLGEKSYKDVNWSTEFPELLASGFRLPLPKMASKEM